MRHGRSRLGAFVCAWACTVVIGCAAGRPPRTARARVAAPAPDGSRWAWVGARCIDASLDLAALGFERELRIEASGGDRLFTYDDTMAVRGCVRSSVWRVTREGQGVRFDPQAQVTLPLDTACGAPSGAALVGEVRITGDTLEVVEQGSPWCRSLDAHFVYRRVEPVPLAAAALVRRWAAHFHRRDPDALARLFARDGILIEPFTPTGDGSYRRHRGRRALRAWLDTAFASAPWSALRLTAIEFREPSREVAASWEYMDANLAEPLVGRTLFIVAAGEIFQSEIQLVSTPRPRVDAEIDASLAATPEVRP